MFDQHCLILHSVLSFLSNVYIDALFPPNLIKWMTFDLGWDAGDLVRYPAAVNVVYLTFHGHKMILIYGIFNIVFYH